MHYFISHEKYYVLNPVMNLFEIVQDCLGYKHSPIPTTMSNSFYLLAYFNNTLQPIPPSFILLVGDFNLSVFHVTIWSPRGALRVLQISGGYCSIRSHMSY